ncbi:hypothetical protein FACS1894198_1610 [Clostridia bacterium]|nr:hypothetical protein FACS1894198_1610 [Clostridia bacterium]
MTSDRYYPIDPGTSEFIKAKISRLAKSYTPEWIFNENDPDIGSTLALVFADMMDGSAHKMNMILYKYRIELMNMLGLTLKPATPARSVVAFSLLKSAPSGVFVKESSPLLAYPDGDDKVVFETDYGVYLTKANIAHIYSLSGSDGKILGIYSSDADDAENENDSESQNVIAFNMFDYSAPGIERNMFVFGSNLVSADCKGGQISLKFKLRFEKHQAGTLAESDIDFKYFMRQPRLPKQEIFEVKAQKVVFEYFNGTGWCKLNTKDDYSELFCGNAEAEISIDFVLPDDMSSTLVNAYESFWIKISVTKAENNFRTPAIHTCPVIEDLRMSYKYLEGVKPEFVTKYSGVEKQDITSEFVNGKDVVVFEPAYDGRNCVFIGFDAKMESGPISIHFDVTVDSSVKRTNNIGFEYSSAAASGGFKELKVIDETENFKHSGCIVFNPPSDFSRSSLFGKSEYWLKLVDLYNGEVFGETSSIKVNDIKLNAVQVSNIQTMEEEIFYVDRMDENMSLALSAGNILKADVFVNEALILSLPEKEELIEKNKENNRKDVLYELDMFGNYVDFFVKWQEVDSFTKSLPNDRHYVLNRKAGKITFGDSKCGMIPRNQPRAAVRVFYSICAGEKGNVEVGAINRPYSYIRFLEDVRNNIPAYAGYDIESVGNALNRGSSLVNNRGRLVTKVDFENAVRNFSDAIDKVRCVVGMDATGAPKERHITIAILMKEFYKSNEVFISLRDDIKEELLKRCDVSVKEDDIRLIEPIFIKLSADVWVKARKVEQAFEIQNLMKTKLCEFLHPVTGNFDGQGWQIGRPPKKSQLYSFLKTLDLSCTVNKIILTGFIEGTDKYGVDFERMEKPIFAEAISGEHNVFVDG